MKDKNTQANNPSELTVDAVNRTALEILAAFEARDAAKVISYYAPDAVIATAPGRPAAKDARAVSKAIKDDMADPNFKMSLSHEKTEVAASGDLAYRRGSFKITATNPLTKKAEQGEGTYLTVFKKQADGSWKTVEDFGV
jgi:ketosteroid isomerase-like protein